MELLDYSPQGIPAQYGGEARPGACMFGLDTSLYQFDCWPDKEAYADVRAFILTHGQKLLAGRQLPELSATHELRHWSAEANPVVLVRRKDTNEIVGHINAGTWMSLCGRIGQWEFLLVHPAHRRQGIATAMVHKLHWILATKQCRELRTVRPVRSDSVRELLHELGYRIDGADPHMAVRIKPMFISAPASTKGR